MLRSEFYNEIVYRIFFWGGKNCLILQTAEFKKKNKNQLKKIKGGWTALNIWLVEFAEANVAWGDDLLTQLKAEKKAILTSTCWLYPDLYLGWILLWIF